MRRLTASGLRVMLATSVFLFASNAFAQEDAESLDELFANSGISNKRYSRTHRLSYKSKLNAAIGYERNSTATSSNLSS